ncbi:Acetylcholinesterase [Folsomia candida]|uniref:Acetylcholinesterase n=1 Tax=Folsomia candida TaxID=158441 RepID=A0A226DJ52_FOLCA|nr:Acetylcholinesterase [Folsomia candida]
MATKLTAIAPYVSNIFSTYYFKAPAFHKATLHSDIMDTYLYHFEFYNENRNRSYYVDMGGVAHGDELHYLFKFDDEPYTDTEQAISSKMIEIFYSFMLYGKPTGETSKAGWPVVTKDSFPYMRINVENKLGTHYGDTFHATTYSGGESLEKSESSKIINPK